MGFHTDNARSGAILFGYALVIICAAGLLSLAAGLWRLPMMNLNREVRQASQQYTETKAALLRDLYTNYTDLDVRLAGPSTTPQLASALRAQQASLVRRMTEQADLIPSSQIPADIAAFLRLKR